VYRSPHDASVGRITVQIQEGPEKEHGHEPDDEPEQERPEYHSSTHAVIT